MFRRFFEGWVAPTTKGKVLFFALVLLIELAFWGGTEVGHREGRRAQFKEILEDHDLVPHDPKLFTITKDGGYFSGEVDWEYVRKHQKY